jgi:aminopeptidase N
MLLQLAVEAVLLPGIPMLRCLFRRDLPAALLCSVFSAACASMLRADPYPRQPVDVEHYRFALVLTDSSDRIEGNATIRLRLLRAGLTRVAIDLAGVSGARQGRGMRVTSVHIGGAPATFAHDGDRVTITLTAASDSGAVVELRIRYAGQPADGLQIKPTPLGDRAFFSDNWPDKGHHWLPLIDHVGDKATMEMDVTAPSHYQVISNGLRIEETDDTRGTRRTVWRESVPISPWLYALGVAHFAVQHVGDYRGVPIETWVFAKQRDAGFHDFAVPTRDALAFYSEWIGPFSYEKLANVQSNSVSGGMEAASAIFYSAGSVSGTRPVRWRNVVIHEIAHQWFGNAVTERDWDHVWLSEGFATYFTLLFIEHAYGRDEFADGLRDSRKTIIAFDARRPDYRVVHDNLASTADVTTNMTYQKGSWTLHMLRQEMGDDRFWAGIRDYYARYRDQTATTADFRAAMERAAGRDLGAFFQQWLFRGGIPRVTGTWRWDAAAKQVIVELQQTQAGEPFRFPIDIGVTVAGNRQRVESVQVTGRSARFTVASDVAPESVVLDPMVRLLADIQFSRQ